MRFSYALSILVLLSASAVRADYTLEELPLSQSFHQGGVARETILTLDRAKSGQSRFEAGNCELTLYGQSESDSGSLSFSLNRRERVGREVILLGSRTNVSGVTDLARLKENKVKLYCPDSYLAVASVTDAFESIKLQIETREVDAGNRTP